MGFGNSIDVAYEGPGISMGAQHGRKWSFSARGIVSQLREFLAKVQRDRRVAWVSELHSLMGMQLPV